MDGRRLLNECPIVIGMMTSIIQSGGSLDSAVRSVADDGPPLSKEVFTEVVRITDTKGGSSIREALSAELSSLPKESEGYSRALLMCCSASESSNEDSRDDLLKEASDVALDAVRTMGEDYGASLTTPCMTVFGIGIMVPLIIMSILPMLSIGGMFGSFIMDEKSLITITLVIVPSIILLVTSVIRSRNPFLKKENNMKDLLYIIPILLSIPLAIVYLHIEGSSEWVFLFSLAPACVAACILMFQNIMRERERDICARSMMDSVFDLGNRMISGENFENATVDSFSSNPGCSTVSDRLSKEFILCRGDLKGAIADTVDTISSEMSLALESIRISSEKDTEDAGRLAMTLGKQFRNRIGVMKGIDLKLKSTTDMMVATSVFFAPMVLGLSVAMLEPLSRLTTFPSLYGTSMILDFYLIELCALISVLVSSLVNGEGISKIVWRFCIMCPISLLIFAVSCNIGL